MRKDHGGFSPEHLAVRQMTMGFVKSMLICIAAKLDIADHLADAARPSGELAKLLGIPDPVCLRLMRGFVTAGLVRHREDGRFELTSLGGTLKKGAPDSLRELAIRVHDLDYRAWGQLLESAKTGNTAFDSVFHDSFYEYLSRHSFSRANFDIEMTASSAAATMAILSAYDFGWAKAIMDVGCGQGHFLAQILQRVPAAAGIFLDCIPQSEIEATLECAGLSSRGTIASRSFFEPLPAADLYILQRVLHNWNDERCLDILRNCRNAVNPQSKILIIEQLMPERTQSSTSAVGSDLAMFVLVGGAERSVSQFRSLLEHTGFNLSRVIPTDTPLHLIEAVPKPG